MQPLPCRGTDAMQCRQDPRNLTGLDHIDRPAIQPRRHAIGTGVVE